MGFVFTNEQEQLQSDNSINTTITLGKSQDRPIIHAFSNDRPFWANILPTYFRHSKYSSFQRQLNYFGFRKLAKTNNHFSVYCQPHFVKEDPERLLNIKRKTHRAKGSTPRRGSIATPTSHPHGCPNYCTMHSPAYTPCPEGTNTIYTPRTATTFGYTCSPHHRLPSSPPHTNPYDPLPFDGPAADVFLVHMTPAAASPSEVASFDDWGENPFFVTSQPILYDNHALKLSSHDMRFLADEILRL
ncbi:Aste57867_4112 [Aphanomyces stellatus]|uniref:Aste57867_4112 protein n=1 Tax=Aphanomyces stellatus TaxID=120398 RepID=A0A485KFD9_9STRA|nr:hypothetical protein As57867_004101 [Aphanomyces stellatus]VFT81243.1 Aste57867_4112 [Aphanomyces stellatus]